MSSAVKTKSFTGLFIFKIQDKEFCLDLKEIINVLKITDSDFHFSGDDKEIKYAGHIYKIISFDRIFNLNYQKSANTRVILVNSNKKLIGFYVDEIIEFMAIDEYSSKISRQPSNDNPNVRLIIKYANREIIVPDLKEVLCTVAN